ncbi:MAG TPA: DMT family transporter [Streptosporangiaceae bacterium]|nr:DMT family transporter [Streptosporangiaceae bacterium]
MTDTARAGASWPVGGFAAILSSIAVGSAVAANSQLTDYPVSYSQALRYGLAAILLWLVSRAKIPRVRPRQLVRLTALSVTGLAGFNVFLIAALRSGDPGTVGAIIGAVPVVLAIAGPLLGGRRPTWQPLFGAVVVALGAMVVHGVDGSTGTADVVWAVLAMLCEAAFSLLALPLLKEFKPLTLSMLVCAIAAPLLAAAGLVQNGLSVPPPTGVEVAAVVHLAVFATAGAFLLWYYSLSIIPVETVGVFAGIVPVAALITSAAIGSTVISLPRFGGAMLVATGIVIGVYGSRSRINSKPKRDHKVSPVQADGVSEPPPGRRRGCAAG